MNSVEKLAAVRDGAKVKALLPYLEAEMTSLLAQVDGKAADLYAKGALTPDVAALLWAERLAYRKVLRHFDQRVRLGAAIGEDIAPEMDLLAQ